MLRDDLLAAALNSAGRGWPVFLLGRSKRPVANCDRCSDAGEGHDRAACPCLLCHGFHAATTDPERIRAMVEAVPGGMLAVRTGEPSGVAVVDIDPRNGGDVRGLVSAGLTPPTAHVVTGSGGWHLWYRWPGRPVPCSAGRLAPGVDVRADGGYVVAPTSINPRTGRPYRWAAGSERRGLVEMPPPLVEACLPPPAPPVSAGTWSTSTASGEGISSPDRLLTAHLNAVRRAPEGRRRATLYGSARGVARMVAAGVITTGDAVAALTAVGREAEQTGRDIRRAIVDGFRAEGVAV